jgi:membrane fusion protein, macrolide-specific efflux system
MKVLPRRRRAVLLNSVLGVVLLGGAGLAYATANDGSTAAGGAQTRTATVAEGTVLATVSGSGTLASPTDAGVDFTTGGTLTSVKVEIGDTVKKGQVLAEVSPTTAQQQVDAAQASLDAAEASLAKAKAGETVTVTSTPAASSGGSRTGQTGTGQTTGQTGTGQTAATTTTTTTKVDASAVAQAEQQVTEAENTLSDSEAALDGTVLKAPVAGTVASVDGKVGDTVSGTGTSSSGSSGSAAQSGSSSSSSGTPSGFVVITNPKGMQVTASFSEADALKVKKGQPATVTLNAQSGTELNAKVLSISSLPSTSSSGSGSGSGSAVQYAARLEITSSTSKLRTGMSATISVVVGEADKALYVPTNAVSGTGTSRTATVVKDDGTTERRTVEVGIEGDSTVQIASGLNAGEKVQLTTTTTSSGGGSGFPAGGFPGVGAGGGFSGARTGGGGRG